MVLRPLYFSRSSRFAVLSAAVVVLLLAGSAAAGNSARNGWKKGKIFYTERCIFCHGEDGRGWSMESRFPRPPVPVPDLTDPSFLGRFNEVELFRVIKQGGTRTGKSRFMPPTGNWLSDSDIRDVITYIRSLVRRPTGARR